ncbi:MAG: sn-glycerol-3-phosphate ABC transporter ATP-binding protein UgpC [Pseudomonadota bacterium]
MPARVELRDIRKSFGETEIIKGVDLTIEPSEFVVLVGPSGCGKSTLLRLVAGLEEITSGDLLFDGDTVNDDAPAKRRVGMVFQSYALYPHMTVAENVGFGLKLAKKDKAEREQRVNDALEVLQLDHLRDRKPSQLSGGQRQRVAIGRAIVRKPNVFLFDEPLSNLDTELRVQMRMEIGRLHRRLKNTVVYVTHDQVEAMTLADRIVVLEAGKVRQVGAPLELYERPANRFVAGFIGTPKMAFLDAKLVSSEGGVTKLAVDGGRGVPVEVSVAQRELPAADGANLTLGVRPEDCWLEDTGQAMIHGEILELERLGADTFAFVDVPGAEDSVAVRLKDPNRKLSPGDSIGVSFDPSRIHLFDAEGETIAPRDVLAPA